VFRKQQRCFFIPVYDRFEMCSHKDEALEGISPNQGFSRVYAGEQ
jgi:hypothetical protein